LSRNRKKIKIKSGQKQEFYQHPANLPNLIFKTPLILLKTKNLYGVLRTLTLMDLGVGKK
jgi:hypothetical protein